MNLQELIQEAYLAWIEHSYAYMLFEETMKIKWERVTLEQSGHIGY